MVMDGWKHDQFANHSEVVSYAINEGDVKCKMELVKKFTVLGSGWVVVVVVLKATLVLIFGPNLKTKTLLRRRPKLNNIF